MKPNSLPIALKNNGMNNRQDKEKKFWDKFANNYDAFIKT